MLVASIQSVQPTSKFIVSMTPPIQTISITMSGERERDKYWVVSIRDIQIGDYLAMDCHFTKSERDLNKPNEQLCPHCQSLNVVDIILQPVTAKVPTMPNQETRNVEEPTKRRMNQDQQSTRFNDGFQFQQGDRPFQPHHMAASESSMYQPQPCLFYQKGHCRFGNQCAHLHELPEIDVIMSAAEYQEWQQKKLMGRIHSLKTIIPQPVIATVPMSNSDGTLPFQMGVPGNAGGNCYYQ